MSSPTTEPGVMIMMGVHHATTGMCAVAGGAALAALGGYGTHLVAHPTTTVLVALVTASHFLRPDIDHPKAIASQLLGPVSAVESEFWRECSRRYYTATRASGDPVEPRAHRGLTHSPVGAVLFGLLAALAIGGSQDLCATLAAGCSAWLAALPVVPLIHVEPGPGEWWWLAVNLLGFVLGLAGALGGRALGLFLALAGRFPLVGILFVGYCATLLAGAYAWRNRFAWGAAGLLLGIVCGDALASDWVWVGLATALGCYGHDLGDGCTTSGAPLRHPLREETPEGTQRWADHGAPRLLRFPTGSRREQFWIYVFVAGTAAACLWVAVLGPIGFSGFFAHLRAS